VHFCELGKSDLMSYCSYSERMGLVEKAVILALIIQFFSNQFGLINEAVIPHSWKGLLECQ
jgi:hypothetical protein